MFLPAFSMFFLCCFVIETQMLMTVSDFAGFFARNHFLEGGLHFSTEGEGGGFRWGASFLSWGDAPEGASVLMGGIKKNCRMGGGAPHYEKPCIY